MPSACYFNKGSDVVLGKKPLADARSLIFDLPFDRACAEGLWAPRAGGCVLQHLSALGVGLRSLPRLACCETCAAQLGGV